MKQGGLLVCSGYLARPVFRLRQSVNGGDVAAIKSASSGADSVTFILHSWGEKTQCLLADSLQHMSQKKSENNRRDVSKTPGVGEQYD